MRVPPYKYELDEAAYLSIMEELRERIGVDVPREGIHVSDLIYCLLKGWHLHELDSRPEGRYAYTGETPDETALVWTVGHSHEAIFGRGRMRGVATPIDGIVGTPDFWETDGTLVEMKSTRYSAKKTPEEMEHYVAQAASYAAMYAQAVAQLDIFHLMGDYDRSHPPQAQLRIWKLTFKTKDLKVWWRELVSRRDVILAPEPPPQGPLSPMWEWECGYCKVRELIGCPGGSEWQAEQAKKKQKQSLDQPATS